MRKFQTTILFDLDGTLIDSTPAILDGFHYAFAHFGATDPSDEKIKRLIGHPLEVMFERLGATQDVQDFVRAYKQRYEQIFLDQTVLLSGAHEAVREASEFANLGVVTTKTSKFSKILLQHLGIAEFFGTIVGREDVKNPKPSAEPILKALENLGIYSGISGENFSEI
ncbi:HAD family hydrolase, partial [uncultured Campylobacter sp.]|uniref:HAD family hydrolase n=1 Tax=uncultured Campylobacter sp. TaxID=218934 RepID=UPI0026069C1C